MPASRAFVVMSIVVVGCSKPPPPQQDVAATPVAASPADAATALGDAAVDAAPPKRLLSAELWILARGLDKLTVVACVATNAGKHVVAGRNDCPPLQESSITAVDARGKSVALTLSEKPVLCDGSPGQFVDVPAFVLAGRQSPPAIAFYPADRAPKLLALGKRWKPTATERKAFLEDRDPKPKIDPIAIAELDGDPEPERLAILTTKSSISVSHSDSFSLSEDSLLLDDGDGEFRPISRAGRGPSDVKVSVPAATDLDGDGGYELWIAIDDTLGALEVLELGFEADISLAEECTEGNEL